MSEKKVVQEYSCEVEIMVISWEQYFNFLIRERVTQKIQDYNVQTGYATIVPENLSSEGSEDCNYCRDCVVIEELKDPSSDIKKQLIAQLEKYGVTVKKFSDDFQDSIELACIEQLENFALPENSVIVEMGKNEYMLAPISRDELLIKLLGFAHGALIVYKPKFFVRFKCGD